MSRKQEYKEMSKRIFLASSAYSTEYAPFIIMAESADEALEIAMKSMQTNNRRRVCLERIEATGEDQVFTIEYVR